MAKSKWPCTEERKKKIWDANRRRVVSQTTKDKISQAGKWRIPWNKGIPMSNEKREQFRLANENRVFTKEYKEKLSKAHKWRKISEETKKKMSIAKTWAWCPRWKGGISSENDKIRSSKEYILWRKACFDRDNFTCQRCSQNWWKLEVHHINNFADYPELRTAIDNGITLCRVCHRLFHVIYWKSNNTRIQIQEFLSDS